MNRHIINKELDSRQGVIPNGSSLDDHLKMIPKDLPPQAHERVTGDPAATLKMSGSVPSDRFIPWYFVLFFILLVIVDGTMVTIAIRTQTGVVTKHPYETGVAYNKIIAASDKQSLLGWRGDITYTPISKQKGILTFLLHDARGRLITIDQLSVRVVRSTQDGMDFTPRLSHGSATVTFPLPGLWEVRVYAKSNGTPYVQSKRIIVE